MYLTPTQLKTFLKTKEINVGDSYLIYNNVENITSYSICTIKDIYEISLTESVYECEIFKTKYRGKITAFKN